MKNFLVLIFLLISVKAYGQASPAVIFNTGYGKVIPEFGLRFKDNKTLISGTANPSVTATDAPIGSIYISSNGLTYQKQDNGSTTNWTPLYFVPIFTDDNRLVRTDGTDNVQQSGVTLSDSDAMTGLTSLDVDLINIDSYIISTTAVDQALELRPNGVGTVDIPYLTNGAALFAGSNGAISQDFANYQYSTLDGLKVDNIRLNDNTISSTDTNGNINLTPEGTGDVVVSTLTDGRVVYNASGALVDDAGLAFNGTTDVLKVGDLDIGGLNTITTSALDSDLVLDANGTGIVDVNAPINLESVTANQVAFSDGISGNIVGNANFTYDSLVNSLTAGALNFIDGIISSTAINGNVTISPDGTGEVDVTAPMNIDNGVSISGSTISGANAAADLVIAPAALRQIELTGDTEINNLFFPAAVGGGAFITTNANNDITLQADGTGELLVTTPAEIEDVRVQDNSITTNVLDGNINLLANGDGDATVTYGTNELSLDPSRTDDNLLRNGDFENQIVEYACTDATGAIVASTIPMQNSARMFQMTVTAAGGYCDFTATTGAKFEGLLFKIGGLFQTELTDVEYCTLVNGAEDNCIPVSAVADDATDPFTQPLRTQSQAGATSVGIRVKTTSSTSGVLNFDKLKAVIGELNTGSAISCDGDLDCRNIFTAKLANSSTVSLEGVDWLDGDCSSGVCNFKSGIFNQIPNCYAQSSVSADRFCSNINLSTTAWTFECRNNEGILLTSTTSTQVTCIKNDSDFKTITQQGVVNVGTAQGAHLEVNRESLNTDIVIGTSPTVIDFPDVLKAEGISWDTLTNSATALKSGRYEMVARFVPFNQSTAGNSFSFFPEVDSGSGFSKPSDVSKQNINFSSDQLRFTTTAVFSFQLNKGDKVRFVVQGTNTNGRINASIAELFPSMTIRSVVDQQSMALSMQGVSRITGEENDRFEKGWANFSGATIGSFCTSSPCTRHAEVGAVGRSMSITRSSTGTYSFLSNGWKEGASVVCAMNCRAETTSGEFGCRASHSLYGGILIANSSGEVTMNFVTVADNNSGVAIVKDATMTFKCDGARQ